MSNEKDVDSLDICESDTGERDEWMYLAELNINTTSNNNHHGLPKMHDHEQDSDSSDTK